METDKIKVNVFGQDGPQDFNMKIDILGMTSAERYNLNPYMEYRIITRGKLNFKFKD